MNQQELEKRNKLINEFLSNGVAICYDETGEHISAIFDKKFQFRIKDITKAMYGDHYDARIRGKEDKLND